MSPHAAVAGTPWPDDGPLQPLLPDWSASPRVGAAMSRRGGGVSRAPWNSLNLGDRVGDDSAAVVENRRRFAVLLGGAQPVWLRQVHGAEVVRLDPELAHGPAPLADAAWTDVAGLACVVQVADCLPLLFAAPEGRAVAAAHAGWRGLASGVVEATLHALCAGAACGPGEVAAWLGPCIGPRQFEVGADVLQAFGASPRDPDPEAFVPRRRADGQWRWLADLPLLARRRLEAAGVRHISGGGWCCFEEASAFFSHRRDGVTGRLAAAVWLRG